MSTNTWHRHTPEDERKAASCKPCICLRWPDTADTTNDTQTVCQLCKRGFYCPFNAVYPVYSFATSQIDQPHKPSTVDADWPELRYLKGRIVQTDQIGLSL